MPETDIDLLAIGEILIDFISTERADSLLEAAAFRRLQGGSPANLAVNVSRLGKRAALLAKMGAGAFGQFLKAEMQRSGVISDYLLLDPGVQTSLVFVSQTSGTPDFEPYRSGDYQLTPEDIPEEAIQRARLLHTTTWPLSRQPSRSAVLKAFAAGPPAWQNGIDRPQLQPQGMARSPGCAAYAGGGIPVRDADQSLPG